MPDDPKKKTSWLPAMFMENFGMGRSLALTTSMAVGAVLVFAVLWFFHSAPPRIVTITTGPVGSSFESNAVSYRGILERNGVALRLLPSGGAQENLARLLDPTAGVEIGFVQSGMSNTAPGVKTNKVVSLGSVSFQPLWIFYRGERRDLLSQFKGQKLVLGPPGSGTRSLGLALLALNGLDSTNVTLLDLDPAAGAQALNAGSIDALFVMGDSASPTVIRNLLHNPGIQLFDFTQADAYTRRLTYLSKLELPMGSIDFGQNIPNHDISLVGPSVDLLARADLNPALSDLLLEAAGEVHGSAGLLRRAGEFPAPIKHDFALSADALRFYKSGKSFTYKYLPFQLASLVNRFIIVFVPMLVVLIPGMRLIPTLLRLRMKFRLYRWYRTLLALDRDLMGPPSPIKQKEWAARLDEIEDAINKMNIPASFADQFYVLRQNVDFVRSRLPREN